MEEQKTMADKKPNILVSAGQLHDRAGSRQDADCGSRRVIAAFEGLKV
jgi:hypothetical protein